MDDNFKKDIDSLRKEILIRAEDPVVKAYTALYLTYDIVDNFASSELNVQEVTHAGQNILHILIMNGGSMIATEISKQAWRSKYSVTRVIDTLEKNGYVTRTQSDHQGDRRKKLISITKKGLAISKKTATISDTRLCYQVMEGLSQQEIEDLYKILIHIGRKTFDLINDSDNTYVYRTT
jgi:DNA-binding MarR family transcriptional regulator